MLMNAQTVHTTVTQWLYVQILMDHSHANVQMVILEMDTLVQVRMKLLQNICARQSKMFMATKKVVSFCLLPSDLNQIVRSYLLNTKELGKVMNLMMRPTSSGTAVMN